MTNYEKEIPILAKKRSITLKFYLTQILQMPDSSFYMFFLSFTAKNTAIKLG